MGLYELKVRADEAPHEVLGRIAVSYEAAIGQRERVEFIDKTRSTSRQFTTFKLEVHKFQTGVHAEFCFRVKRDEWPEIMKKVNGA